MGVEEFLRLALWRDARGLSEDELVPGAQRSTMDALAEATEGADQVLAF